MFNNTCVQILQKMNQSELRALQAFIKQREPQKNRKTVYSITYTSVIRILREKI